MKLYLIDDDDNVCRILKILIEKKKLGEVCGMASNGLDALEDLAYITPDIVIVDLLMPLMDGITFVKKAKESYPELSFIMLSQVDSKEMVSQAYQSGITFFIQKPVNGVEVERVLLSVIETIKMRRTFNQVQSLLGLEPAAASQLIDELGKPAVSREEKPYMKKMRSILQTLGILGESGSGDILTVGEYIIEQNSEDGRFSVSDLCSRFSPANPKAMEQRIRRAVASGLTNLANMGIETYGSETFNELAGSLYSFEQIRREMDYIRGKSDLHGKVSLKNFINALVFASTN